jgi:hypothetical protein
MPARKPTRTLAGQRDQKVRLTGTLMPEDVTDGNWFTNRFIGTDQPPGVVNAAHSIVGTAFTRIK